MIFIILQFVYSCSLVPWHNRESRGVLSSVDQFQGGVVGRPKRKRKRRNELFCFPPLFGSYSHFVSLTESLLLSLTCVYFPLLFPSEFVLQTPTMLVFRFFPSFPYLSRLRRSGWGFRAVAGDMPCLLAVPAFCFPLRTIRGAVSRLGADVALSRPSSTAPLGSSSTSSHASPGAGPGLHSGAFSPVERSVAATPTPVRPGWLRGGGGCGGCSRGPVSSEGRRT
jgi:hypothetical protein